MKEITLHLAEITVLPVTEGDESATMQMVEAHPTTMPNGQIGLMATEIHRVPLNKPILGELIDSLQEAYDNLPDPRPQSNLIVPESMSQVDQIASNLKRFNS